MIDQIELYLIPGICLGVEYVPGDENFMSSLVIDLFILRIMFSID
jgi:hypothetical protein